MGATKYDRVDASANIQVVSSLPTSPSLYYGIASNDVDSVAWKGGEIVYHSGDNRMYIQTATSGVTAVWKRLLTQFATTTSTSTSTSSSTSTSTSSTTTMP